VSCSAPQRVTETYLRGLAELSDAADIPYNMHILETRSQRIFGDTRYGMSLVRYAQARGVLSERCQVIHAVWIDDTDVAIRRVAHSGRAQRQTLGSIRHEVRDRAGRQHRTLPRRSHPFSRPTYQQIED
jgi:hypothetical protein